MNTLLFVIMITGTALLAGYFLFRFTNKQIKMCSYLKRIADLKPGAFLFIAGKSPTLLYAREEWIGKVVFGGSNDDGEGTTSLEAIIKHSCGRLTVSKKDIMTKTLSWPDKDKIILPESDFSSKFTVSCTVGGFADKIFSQNIHSTIMQLEEFKKPLIEIEGKSVVIKINDELSSTRKEAELKIFLEIAEHIVDAVVQQAA
jgi:hypothetical protein